MNTKIVCFGEKLRQIRTYNNLTLKQLASLLGYSTHSYLSEIERGLKTPTVELVLELARLFDYTTDQLLKDDLKIDLKPIKYTGK